MRKVNVEFRFPNEMNHDKVKLDLDDFKIHHITNDEVFGYYGFQYMAIKRDSLPKDFLGE